MLLPLHMLFFAGVEAVEAPGCAHTLASPLGTAQSLEDAFATAAGLASALGSVDSELWPEVLTDTRATAIVGSVESIEYVAGAALSAVTPIIGTAESAQYLATQAAGAHVPVVGTAESSEAVFAPATSTAALTGTITSTVSEC